MGEKYKIGWFSSGRGEGSRNLLRAVWDSIAEGEIDAGMSWAFCNREQGQAEGSDAFIRQVNGYGIPLVCVSSQGMRERHGDEWRPRFEEEAMRALEGREADIVVLAGYMLIAGADMCRRYPMLNLHPAVPGGPKGTWKEVIWELIDRNAAETGVMMHRATPVLDEGPPVTFCTFSIRGIPFDKLWDDIKGRPVADIQGAEGEENALFKEIRRHGAARELPLIVATLKAFSQGRVRIEGDGIVDSGGNTIEAYDLSDEVDKKVQRSSSGLTG
jgi:folate-dependent phosphoribosylglycinamide formyltransferase PurN